MFRTYRLTSSKYIDLSNDVVRSKALDLIKSGRLRGIYDGDYAGVSTGGLLRGIGISTSRLGAERHLARASCVVCPETDIEEIMRLWNELEDIASVHVDIGRDENDAKPKNDQTGATITTWLRVPRGKDDMVFDVPGIADDWENLDDVTFHAACEMIDGLIAEHPIVSTVPLSAARPASVESMMRGMESLQRRVKRISSAGEYSYEKFIVWKCLQTDDNPVTVCRSVANEPATMYNLMKHGCEFSEQEEYEFGGLTRGNHPEMSNGVTALLTLIAFVDVSGFRYEKVLRMFDERRIWEDFAIRTSDVMDGMHHAYILLRHMFDIDIDQTHTMARLKSSQ